jgi:hypothetical protein
MAEVELDGRDEATQRGRVQPPNCPVLALPMAIQCAAKIFQQEGNVPVPREGLLRDLGFSGPTATALRTVAALKTYGLLVQQAGEYRLTDDALRVLQLGEADPERHAAILRLADRPEMFQELRRKYPEGLPSDRTVKIVLIKEWGFAHAAVDGVLEAFRQTMAFVKEVTGVTEPWSSPAPSADVIASAAAPLQASSSASSFTPPPAPVALPRPSTSGALQIWSLGTGVTVELRSSVALRPEHFDLLTEYVGLARRAALGASSGEEPLAEDDGVEPSTPIRLSVA